MAIVNLLEETEQVLYAYGFSWDDIDFIGGRDFSISLEDFRKIAGSADYDTGFGTQEVASDLVIVTKNDGWFERYEYDGGEGWVYQTKPKKPAHSEHVSNLTAIQAQKNGVHAYGWSTLKQLNRE